jgi:hypothetical protein
MKEVNYWNKFHQKTTFTLQYTSYMTSDYMSSYYNTISWQ